MPTFNKEIKISGVGIHSGLPVNVVIKPSEKYGIFMRRTDMVGSELISAMYDNVGETKMRNTTIGNTNGAHVQTIEHLMVFQPVLYRIGHTAAFGTTGIDLADHRVIQLPQGSKQTG